MTSFWSLFIGSITFVSIAALVWLLIATARSDASSTGHVWDEDLTENNNPLPRWWLGLFLITVLFSALYLAFYPGFGANEGTLGWSSTGEVNHELAEANAKLDSLFAQFRDKPIETLESDPKAIEIGHNVFVNNCAACHGSDARGAKGYPNLTDGDWLYGGSSDQVLTTISKGRGGVMPAWGAALGDQGVDEVANYVLSLSGRKVDAKLAEAGKARFATMCIACHGPDGKGNIALGAPNLTDDIWLYGSSLEDVKTSIRNGRDGKMPTWDALLGPDRVRLVAAWVLAQSQPPKTASTP